jgi:hypothetical protein
VIESLLFVLGVAVVAGVVLRGIGWLTRDRVVRAIPAHTVRRSARGVSLRVLTAGPTTFPGMNPSRANRTVGDLVITDDRFVVVCGRGLLIDARAGAGGLITSARAPGPDRLVVEGRTPAPTGEPGTFRVELVVPDARGWADAIRPFLVT